MFFGQSQPYFKKVVDGVLYRGVSLKGLVAEDAETLNPITGAEIPVEVLQEAAGFFAANTKPKKRTPSLQYDDYGNIMNHSEDQ